MRPRRNNQYARHADSAVLKIAATNLLELAGIYFADTRKVARLRDAASRLRAIARRVPLWTDRMKP